MDNGAFQHNIKEWVLRAAHDLVYSAIEFIGSISKLLAYFPSPNSRVSEKVTKAIHPKN
jgi:hypothetical protein